MKKIALMFLTRGELFNSDIWESFFDENLFNVYIHPDMNHRLEKFNNFQISNLVHKARGYNILASLELLKEAFKNKDNYKFVLLSEDCIPIKDKETFYNYCIKDNLSNIRYGQTWFNRGDYRFINEVDKENQMANADWWMLNRENAFSIINNEDDIKNIYSKYAINGEHAPSTIIKLSGQLNDKFVKNKDILYENYTFIDSGGDYSEFCEEQLNLIKEDLYKRGYFFLRKYKTRNKKYNTIVEHTHWNGIRNYEL
jgi:hypothetical protein